MHALAIATRHRVKLCQNHPATRFQVMDGPASFASNGLPYVFDRFRFQATVNLDAAEPVATPVPAPFRDVSASLGCRAPPRGMQSAAACRLQLIRAWRMRVLISVLFSVRMAGWWTDPAR